MATKRKKAVRRTRNAARGPRPKTRRAVARPKRRKSATRPTGRRAGVQPALVRTLNERTALQTQVARDRAATYAEYVRQLAAPAGPPGAERRAVMAAGGPPQQRLRILAEGDSWFEYPPGDGVIVRLRRLLGYPIANMAHHGDEVRMMLGLNQRLEIISRLSDPNVRFDALLFSGGGNDLVGDQFCLWLKDARPGVPPEDLLRSDRVQAALACVEAGYRDLIQIRDTHSPQTAIFLHGYDFPPITGRGACLNLVGPWLRPSLDFRNVAVGDDQFRVVRELLRRFGQTLHNIAASTPSGKVFLVPTQGTLSPNDSDWQNEIHPSSGGFIKIAEKFRDALAAQFP